MTTGEMNGKISLIERKGVKIHTYTSPEYGLLVNTHIIETGNRLVIVDTQLLRPHAKEVKEYAESLGKPVDRIIITHSHPDHWFGLEYFEGLPVYSLLETKKEIEKDGEMYIKAEQAVFGEAITTRVILPGNEIALGEETIDGLEYEFEKIDDAEAGVQMLIKLPELAAMIVQDIAFNKVHLFMGQNAFDNWVRVLRRLKRLAEYDTILIGHGENSGRSVFDQTISYLEYAKRIFESVDNGNELKRELIKKYPEHRAPVILDISNLYLFPPARPKSI